MATVLLCWSFTNFSPSNYCGHSYHNDIFPHTTFHLIILHYPAGHSAGCPHATIVDIHITIINSYTHYISLHYILHCLVGHSVGCPHATIVDIHITIITIHITFHCIVYHTTLLVILQVVSLDPVVLVQGSLSVDPESSDVLTCELCTSGIQAT